MGDKTLKEIIDELPDGHAARAEYNTMIEELDAFRVVTVPPHPPEPAPVEVAPPPVEPAHGE